MSGLGEILEDNARLREAVRVRDEQLGVQAELFMAQLAAQAEQFKAQLAAQAEQFKAQLAAQAEQLAARAEQLAAVKASNE